jgi:hypothetical protein
VIISDVPRLGGHVEEVYKMSETYGIVTRKPENKRYSQKT